MTEILAAVIGAVVGSVLSWWLTRRVSYPQGVEQGKQLVLHEKSVEVLTEIRKRLMSLRSEWVDWVNKLPDEDESRASDLLSKQRRLEEYYEENKLVISSNIQRKVETIIGDIERNRQSFLTNLLASGLAEDEKEQRNRRYRAGVEMLRWLEYEFPKFREDLDSCIRKIIGADGTIP